MKHQIVTSEKRQLHVILPANKNETMLISHDFDLIMYFLVFFWKATKNTIKAKESTNGKLINYLGRPPNKTGSNNL